MTKRISILGVTGSIGQSTVDVIKAHPDKFAVQAVTAHQNVQKLADLAVELNARAAVIADEDLYKDLKSALSGRDIEVLAGHDAICEAASMPADIVMAGIVGMAGLKPLMAAIEQGCAVAIANKEPLVAAGEIIMQAAKKSGGTLLPVDSEHNAIFQVFDPAQKANIERIILTASGGPFRTMSLEEMERATPAQALAHPNWSMGDKISVDSATMMNKALEVIEAAILFDMPADKIEVLVHPESIIHSMVEYADGSILAQMGAADMRTPITNILGYPERLGTPGQRLDFRNLKRMSFEQVDRNRFPAVDLAYRALKDGPAARIAMNAANEIAVQAFLEGRIGFLDITNAVCHTLDRGQAQPVDSLDEVLAYDEKIRTMLESDDFQPNNRKQIAS